MTPDDIIIQEKRIEGMGPDSVKYNLDMIVILREHI